MPNILDELYEETTLKTMTMEEFYNLPVNPLYAATQLKKKEQKEKEELEKIINLNIINEKHG